MTITDTLIYTPAAIHLLVDSVGSDRVVVRTDYPFDMGSYDVESLIAAVADCRWRTARRFWEAAPPPCWTSIRRHCVTHAGTSPSPRPADPLFPDKGTYGSDRVDVSAGRRRTTRSGSKMTPVRRIVTGHDAAGKSVFLSIGEAPQLHHRTEGLVQALRTSLIERADAVLHLPADVAITAISSPEFTMP